MRSKSLGLFLKRALALLVVIQALYFVSSQLRISPMLTVSPMVQMTDISVPITVHTLPKSPPHSHESKRKKKGSRWVEQLLSFYLEQKQQGEISADEYCVHLTEHVWNNMFPEERGFTAEFVRLLAEHREMHAAVAAGTPRPGQTYLVWSLSGGLGNRFQSLASTFVAALLSRRVLLLKDWFTPLPPNSKNNKPMIFNANYTSEYALEALEKLFWFSNPLMKETSPRPTNKELLCPLFPMMSLSDFHAMYPNHFDNVTLSVGELRVPPYRLGHVKIDISARHDKYLVRWNRFACANLTDHSQDSDTPWKGVSRDSQALFFPETFVYVWTNQYYLPLLYANPFHGNLLRRALPYKPYTTLIKALILPSSHVMERIAKFFVLQRTRFPATPLLPGRYVALQVRAFSFKEMPDLARSFKLCLNKHNPISPFFLATMHEDIRSNFGQSFNEEVMRTQTTRAAGDQLTGKGAAPDVEALADMLILSLGKRLILSPGSTFGKFAVAFGEIEGEVVNWKSPVQDAKHVCTPMTTDQPCLSSWLRYDRLHHRSNLGTNRSSGNEIRCVLLPPPSFLSSCV